MRSPKFLLLFPNPWNGGLDHNERPKNACAYPHDGSRFYTMQWLGATPALDADGDQCFLFDCLDPSTLDFLPKSEPVRVSNSGEASARWKQAVRHGEVLAADAATYAEVFGRAVQSAPAGSDKRALYFAGMLFVSPAEMMDLERAECERLHGHHGRGAPDPKPFLPYQAPHEAVAELRNGVPEHVAKARAARVAAATAAVIARAAESDNDAHGDH